MRIIICGFDLGALDSGEDLVYGWDLMLRSGQLFTLSGYLADQTSQEANQIHFTGFRKPQTVVLGRCNVARKNGKGAYYYSKFFEIGSECNPGK